MLGQKQKIDYSPIFTDALDLDDRKWQRNQYLRSWAAHIMMVAAIAGGIGKIYNNDTLFIPKALTYKVENNPAPKVAPAQFEKVLHLLSTPQSPELTAFQKRSAEIDKRVAQGQPMPSREQEQKFQNERHDFYAREAKKFGFHLGDTPTYSKAIDQAKTPQEVIDIMNDLTQQYGFSVSFPQSVGIEDLPIIFKPVNLNTAKLGDIKADAQCIIWGVQMIPLELARKLHIRGVKIVHDDHDILSGHQEGGTENNFTDYIYVTDDSGMMDTFQHEMGHRIDKRLSGVSGMFNDPGFEALNPPDFKYGHQQLAGEEEYGRPFEHPKAALVEEYGSTNPAEDKATYYNVILNEWEPGTRGPITKKKIAYLVAQMDKLLPGYADYYARVSYRK